MSITETEIWERFNTNKSSLIESKWLEQIYSLNLSYELRSTIGERLGLSAKQGWGAINLLIKKYGPQPELINAAGLCHQTEARDFLLKLLRQQQKPEINTVRALACWGAILQIDELKRILNDNSMNMRLAGLNLLKFKSHQLEATQLLDLVHDLMHDFREEVVLQVIKLLQRRDEEKIINSISNAAKNGTDEIVKIALIALGSIGTEYSFIKLTQLSLELRKESHREIAKIQLSHQYLQHS